MWGLTVRWSLAEAPAGVDITLREYVRDTSLARFTGMDGLRFKTWRVRPGEWFDGVYVFATQQARDDFAASFAEMAADAPVSKIVGAPPVAQEPFDIVAVAEGGEGFAVGAGPWSAG